MININKTQKMSLITIQEPGDRKKLAEKITNIKRELSQQRWNEKCINRYL